MLLLKHPRYEWIKEKGSCCTRNVSNCKYLWYFTPCHQSFNTCLFEWPRHPGSVPLAPPPRFIQSLSSPPENLSPIETFSQLLSSWRLNPPPIAFKSSLAFKAVLANALSHIRCSLLKNPPPFVISLRWVFNNGPDNKPLLSFSLSDRSSVGWLAAARTADIIALYQLVRWKG